MKVYRKEQKKNRTMIYQIGLIEREKTLIQIIKEVFKNLVKQLFWNNFQWWNKEKTWIHCNKIVWTRLYFTWVDPCTSKNIQSALGQQTCKPAHEVSKERQGHNTAM